MPEVDIDDGAVESPQNWSGDEQPEPARLVSKSRFPEIIGRASVEEIFGIALLVCPA